MAMCMCISRLRCSKFDSLVKRKVSRPRDTPRGSFYLQCHYSQEIKLVMSCN
jgi:transposase